MASCLPEYCWGGGRKKGRKYFLDSSELFLTSVFNSFLELIWGGVGVDFTDWRFFVHEKQLYFLEFHLNYLLCLSLTINYTAYHLKKKKSQ